ncbi:Phosphatidylinositol synthase [Trachipleistophora hominis]|uniref:Phosphatidylinositol synthase n=1 Tax=Trachipleistophora hominis TaxID=72359 RepID=L7JX57_TRAHO|nr:Phosphatidylinositol synthase [Trachipleistophora hominis]
MNTAVLFYIPNLVNYLRLLLIISSIYLHGNLFLLVYTISSSIDLIDGTIARSLNQTSKLGACLDMFTDRLTTTIIVCKILERKRSKSMILLLFIDLLSHMLLFTSSMAVNVSHKEPILSMLKVYYQKVVLVLLCVGTEVYYVMKYLDTYKKVNKNVILLFYTFLIVKSFFHFLQLIEGMCRLSDLDGGKN